MPVRFLRSFRAVAAVMLLGLFSALYSGSVYADRALPVFPGAEGYGIDTPAGRGGTIIRVTSLASEGEGTLREALRAEGPRVIVFEVGGVIDLEGETLRVVHPFVTVAGQTAPESGITLIRGGMHIATHDVLIQHLRIRPGDDGQPEQSGWEPDGITLSTNRWAGEGQPRVPAHRVVIDHCSITWAVDENLSATGPRHHGAEATSHQVTFSNCIVAEGLNQSSHGKGPHSKGTLLHDHVRDVAIVRNLYASNVDRNPMLKPNAGAVVVNNLIYNPHWAAIRTVSPASEYEGRLDRMGPADLAIAGNVYWHGPDTPHDLPLLHVDEAGPARVYLSDNIVDRGKGQFDPTETNRKTALLVKKSPMAEQTYLDEPPLWPAVLTVLPAEVVAAHVLTNAGAWPAARDAIDQRIVEGVRQRSGRIIDSQDEVGGYPAIEPTRHELAIPSNPHADDNGDGYTNLEAWLHERAAQAERREAD